MVKNDSKHLLFIEPIRGPSAEPVVDDLTRRLTAAWRWRVTSVARYRGVHTNPCDPGVASDNADHYVGGPEGVGMMTHSLCLRYIAYFRAEAPPAELEKVRLLPEEFADPTPEELAGGRSMW